MKFFRFLLFPIAFVFFCVSKIRNYLYDSKIWKTYVIPVKSISVGNLSLGGTGKSPLVAFLIQEFFQEHSIQVLSRGYGRKTKGFKVVSENSEAQNVGDEPLMYKKRFQDNISVAVCESRKDGIEQILKDKKPELLLLDDAFQHRKVKAGFSIILTDFTSPYFSDFIFPVGNLRESKSGKKRADLLIVSKCPKDLDQETKRIYLEKLEFKAENVYFSSIKYTDLIPFSTHAVLEVENVLLVTGIANPKPLEEFLEKKYRVEILQFKDHHQFSLADIEKIYKKFDTFATDKKIIVTSEKDYVRLVAPEFSVLTSEKPWYYQAIAIEIDRQNEFINKIKQYVSTI